MKMPLNLMGSLDFHGLGKQTMKLNHKIFLVFISLDYNGMQNSWPRTTPLTGNI